jgi:hypothetical protein
MVKQTKEGKARNSQLFNSYKSAQANVDQDIEQVKQIVAAAFTNGGMNEDTMDKLASVFRGYEYIKPIADESWERYENHCITFNYEIKY